MNTIRCVVCGSAVSAVSVSNDYVACYMCNIAYSKRLTELSPDEYINYYADENEFHIKQQKIENLPSVRDRFSEHYKASVMRVSIYNMLMHEYLPHERWLDVGSGSGHFLAAANERKDMVSEVVGAEICDSLAAFSSEKTGCIVVPCSVDNLSKYFCRESFDAIFMHDVFEHLLNPISTLSNLTKFVRKDGYIVIEQPEYWSPNCRLQGAKWRHFRPMQHIMLFSANSMWQIAKMLMLDINAFYRPLSGKLGKMVHIMQVS